MKDQKNKDVSAECNAYECVMKNVFSMAILSKIKIPQSILSVPLTF